MPAAVMILGPEERIVRANAEARALFGDCVGMPCASVVGAVGAVGEAICALGCASALVHAEGGQSEARRATIAGLSCRLLCVAVERNCVVVIEARPPTGRRPVALAPRERQALELAKGGLTDRRIAVVMGVGPATVRTYLDRARRKLGAQNRVEAVALALAAGEIP